MELNDEVKGYLSLAVRRGVSVARILEMMKRAGLVVFSQRNTIERFHREDARRLVNANDLLSFQKFFTTNLLGRDLIGATPVDITPSSDRTKPLTGDGTDNEPIERRGMGVRLGPGPSPGPDTRTDLGTIVIGANQWGQGTVGIDLSVYCNIWEGMTLRRIRIDLYPHPGKMRKEHRNHWKKPQRQRTELDGHDGQVLLRCYNSEFDPFWQVDGSGAPVGCFDYPNFAELEQLSPGDRVTVTLTAKLRDLAYEEEDSQQVADRRDDILEVDANGQTQNTMLKGSSKTRQRIMAMIRQHGLDIGADGNAEIASHVLVIGEHVPAIAEDDK